MLQEAPPTEISKLSRAEKGEAQGSGIIVGRRKKNGRLLLTNMPFEHPSTEAAIAEAGKLAERYPGSTFEVFSSVGIVSSGVVEGA